MVVLQAATSGSFVLLAMSELDAGPHQENLFEGLP